MSYTATQLGSTSPGNITGNTLTTEQYRAAQMGSILQILDQMNGSSGKGLANARIASGIASSRPSAGNAGSVYFATDTKVPSWDDGSAWHTAGVLDVAGTYTALQSFGTNLGGTLQTAAQPNITSVGVLASPHMTSPTVDSGGMTVTGNVGIGGAPSNEPIRIYAAAASAGQFAARFIANATAGQSYGLTLQAGTNATDQALAVLNQGGSTQMFAVYGDGGVTAGSPTAASKGAGTINTAADVYKNNSAYTNPGYVAEHYFTGDIVLFAESPSACDYPGLLTLDELDAFMQANLELPRVAEARGAFERHDILLEKVEEQALYILQLHARLKAIGA